MHMQYYVCDSSMYLILILIVGRDGCFIWICLETLLFLFKEVGISYSSCCCLCTHYAGILVLDYVTTCIDFCYCSLYIAISNALL
jgi:hypothetical protein